MKVLDLFSGIGGFSLGLERAGMETVAFCEIDPFCWKVLRKHWPDVPIYEDVRTLTGEQAGTVDVICGGFPCQDVSLAGARAGLDGERSGLWKEFARLVGEIRPRYVLVENTPGLLSLGMGRVLGDLAALGYDAWWECLRACDLGAPHIRDRVWIVAYATSRQERVAAAINSRRKFEEARAFQGAQVGRRISDFGGKNWGPEPNICRVDDGISKNVDRISALGNAVVPQIPELIGKAIMEAENVQA